MEDLRWEGPNLFEWADSGANAYPTRAICSIGLYETNPTQYRIRFVLPIDGQQTFGPYPTLEEAKAAALAVWRLR